AAQFWLARANLVREHPHLRAAQLASQTALEHELTEVLAERVGLDADDLYPSLVARAGLTAFRLALERAGAHGPAALRREITTAFALLEQGLRPPDPPKRRRSR